MTPPDCKGCRLTTRLVPGEVDRLLGEFLQTNPLPVVVEETYLARLEVCAECPDLKYETTCRHCGCLVAVRAKLAPKTCPAPMPRW